MARMRKKRRPVKKLNRTMRAKLIVLFAAFVLLLCGLIGVLTYIESTSGDKYEKKFYPCSPMTVRRSLIREGISSTVQGLFWQPARQSTT